MNEVQEILQLLNPWWKTPEISKDLAKPLKREKFVRIQELSNYRQAIILSGLRRVGKSTLLYQKIEDLLKKTGPKNILYFSFDKRVENIISVLESYQELTGKDYKKEKIFVFFDEITRLGGWANQIKILYDAFPKIKFFLSSSSSINLEEEAIKNLAGRYFLLNIKPLSFHEYLKLRGMEKLIKETRLFEKELKKEFDNYLLRSFPETVDWKDELAIKDYMRTTILDKIIKSDLPDRFRGVNKSLLLTLIELFYKQPGLYLDYDSIAKSLKISKKTLFSHIYYLEFCYLIRKIKNFRPSTFSTTRKMQRVYPYWWSLAYCYSDDKDRIMENLIASVLDAKYYWRKDGKEVDFLNVISRKIIPVEVKNAPTADAGDLKNMLYFLERNKITKGVVVYQGEEKTETFGKRKIQFIRFWKFLLSMKGDEG
ncbi:MAG: ATP-binding protein [Candidatus Aenigmarchaeota archaeon]|nr:ATP-binding protein [Candidatus Aenigmarchaeota archaeon]